MSLLISTQGVKFTEIETEWFGCGEWGRGIGGSHIMGTHSESYKVEILEVGGDGGDLRYECA